MKKWFKKISPNADSLREHKHLRFLGRLLHDPLLWHFNRRGVAWAFTVGLFCMYLPVPFQMIWAALLAIVIRANVPISVVLVWVTNPITMPPMLYFAYKVGAFLLGLPPSPVQLEFSLEWLMNQLAYIWEPLLLGSVICGLVCGIVGQIIIRVLWRCVVARAWKKRQAVRNTSLP
ncbi:MAG: DUF2062 domain-containing protein [Legionellales bacterium]|nr:DUF2062 domain-containing protein [Legionellales bacterium]